MILVHLTELSQGWQSIHLGVEETNVIVLKTTQKAGVGS